MAKRVQKIKAKKSKGKSIKMDAKSHLERAIKIKPDFLNAYFELGCLLMEEGNLSDAEKQFNQVIKL